VSNGPGFQYALRAEQLAFAPSDQYRAVLQEQRDRELEDHLAATATKLNGIQYDRTAVTTDGSGQATINFPSAFTALPSMSQPAVAGTSVYVATITSLSKTSFTVSVRSITTGTLFVGSITIMWQAFGELA
jgi:hypothetical protein